MRERILALILALVLLAVPFAVAQPLFDAEAQGTYYREVQFDDGNVITADEQTSAFTGFAEATLAAFILTCTEDSGTATLDAAIQRSIDGGASWADIVAFTQLSAGGSQTLLYADVRAATAQMIGDRLRVDYDITGTGQYTCDVFGAFEA